MCLYVESMRGQIQTVRVHIDAVRVLGDCRGRYSTFSGVERACRGRGSECSGRERACRGGTLIKSHFVQLF